MYIEKFKSDTLDQALKDIKLKLGPDAIILKTVSNKGLSGALRKSKIEVTAAISEEEYNKKKSVDKALGDNHKEKFYQSSSNHISKMIKNYSEKNNSYGKVALNQTVKKVDSKPSNVGLDQFLANGRESEYKPSSVENKSEGHEEEIIDYKSLQYVERIDLLEKKVFDLAEMVENFSKPEPKSMRKIKTTLQSFGLNESFITKVLGKAAFEMTQEELDCEHNIFEVVLREMSEVINIDLPLFSNTKNENPTITFLLSEDSTGQSSTSYKLSALKENSVLVRYLGYVKDYSLSKKIFGIEEVSVKSMPEIVAECRKGIKDKKSVFVDYKIEKSHCDEVKGFIKGLRRSFSDIEILTCLSTTCSEGYNRKLLSRYRDLLDGIIFTKLDLCLDFGSLFNLHIDFNEIPLKMFTTGCVIPDDLETATKERLLNGMFKFDKNNLKNKV